ncbi:TPA: preprotein translocase subunit SecY [Patescibacteria group bacterium]|uniref:Protein translocase subunit SecY n=2 Tax=Bacteria division Kazan-3B-28 TaxID=1798534 RepID=A0A0G4BA54_UNCK3|nr:MAG: preprotein translocase subunit SecY, preprotein translocase subunit SecY [candidate division Kazan bacterium GW2011_GWA1_50_15]HAV65720.1 preprotein translocase subunit SecY [Patescibacteria group bacterium]HCL47582.1 preprotein translocase subunit SecY [Patescibacteria group bacterium]HCR42908.1 preprotein translocase subunit SecY [Patescibacteria group bacterium]
MLATITHIWKHKDLRNRILMTLLLLVIVRLVVHTPMPGVNLEALQQVFSSNQFLGLVDLFSGGALNKFSIAMMGVAPYINASIIMQLMTMAIPSIEALQKEGEYGRRKINQYTRLLTVPLGLLQSWGMVSLLQRSDVSILGDISPLRLMAILMVVTAGTMLLMWLGELISEMGIGNGVSLIIFVGILEALPSALSGTIALFDVGKLVNIIIFGLLAIITIYFVVYITEGQRNIPIAYAGRGGGNRLFSGQTNHLPLRVNQAGVIPIIFALSLLLFPGLIASFFAAARTPWIAQAADFIQKLFQDQLFYGVLYFVLVVFFTYFYTWVIFRPDNVAENIQRSGGFIPGIRPGKQTVDFLTFVSNRITLAGAIFLGLIAILPLLAQAATGITTLSLGGTGLLIVVSVALETMRQIRAQLIMKQYDEI